MCTRRRRNGTSPDGAGGWMRSSPRAHKLGLSINKSSRFRALHLWWQPRTLRQLISDGSKAYVRQLDEAHGGKVKPLVMLGRRGCTAPSHAQWSAPCGDIFLHRLPPRSRVSSPGAICAPPPLRAAPLGVGPLGLPGMNLAAQHHEQALRARRRRLQTAHVAHTQEDHHAHGVRRARPHQRWAGCGYD